MNFFDYIQNDSFFKPFASKYRRVYYDCMELLIERVKERPVLYESDARDAILSYFKVRKMEPALSAEQELAPSAMITLFRECGWVAPREIGRNGEYVLNVETDCRRLMDFLERLANRHTDGTMSNRIFTMFEIMKSLTEKDSIRRERPFANILMPMTDNMTELRSELSDLKDSIADIMKTVISLQDMNSFGQFIMKDLMLERFFSEYFFIKNNGLIPSQLSFIRSRVRSLKDGPLVPAMIAECAEIRELSRDEASYYVEKRFSDLQYFLSVEYESHMELIDRRINNYYNLANTRISLMASSGTHLDAAIASFLDALSGMEADKRGAVLGKTADCLRLTRHQYVGGKSFEKQQRISRREGTDLLPVNALSDPEKQSRTRDLFENTSDRFAVSRVESFLAAKMGNVRKLSTGEEQPRTREEAMMYAASMMYADNEEFAYEVEVKGSVTRGAIATMSDLVIRKKA